MGYFGFDTDDTTEIKGPFLFKEKDLYYVYLGSFNGEDRNGPGVCIWKDGSSY